MKGFGGSREKSSIARAIATHNRAEVEKAMEPFAQRLSAREMASFLFEIVETLPPEDMAWAYANLVPEEAVEEIQQEAVATIYQLLMELGFELGRDFSATEQGVRMSRAASEALLLELPEEFRNTLDELVRSGAIAIEEESPIDRLEQQLGVPFVENLLQRIEQRLPTLTNRQAATYLYNIFEGVEARTGIPMVDLVCGRFRNNKRIERILQAIEAGDEEENSDWVYDLAIAAGAQMQPMSAAAPDRFSFNRRALALLDAVYLGEKPAFLEEVPPVSP